MRFPSSMAGFIAFIGKTGFYCGLISMPSTDAWARTRISAGFGWRHCLRTSRQTKLFRPPAILPTRPVYRYGGKIDAICLKNRMVGNIPGLWTTDCPTRPRASGSPIFFVQDGVLMVVALMEGHLGSVNGNEILPKWDPNRANLAVDMGKILSSDADILKLITQDIDRYYQTDPARTVATDTNQIKQPNQLQVAQPGDASAVAPPAPSDNIRAVQPQPSQIPSEPGP